MTDKKNPLGLAPLRMEGVIADWETGEPVSPARAAAYEAREIMRSAFRKEFKAAVKKLPAVLTPAWLASQYDLAERIADRDLITYLRRLVLWRMASGQIEHPQECAAIVMPEGED